MTFAAVDPDAKFSSGDGTGEFAYNSTFTS